MRLRARIFAHLLFGLGGLAACTAGGSRESAPALKAERAASVTQDLSANDFVGTTLANKTLALTFDDGPGDGTIALSTYLKAQNIKATFFVNGAHIAATAMDNPNGIGITTNAAGILAQLKADGHLVANHTTTHRSLTGEDGPLVPANQRIQELTETDTAIATYVSPANHLLFRPPYGNWNGAVFAALSTSPMNKYIGPINWDVGGGPTNATQAADWECWNLNYTTKQCGDRYRAEIAAVGKGIVLMHDPYGDLANHAPNAGQGNTVDMVKYLVPLLKGEGYSFVRADEVPSIAAALPCDLSCTTCTGPRPNQCTSCGPDKYLAAGTCTLCTVCAPETYQSAACTATANTQCVACTVCAPNDYRVTACTTAANTTCAPCSVCPAGKFASKACAEATDTVCTDCASGTYSAAGASTCTSCGSCDDGDACTTDACDKTRGCVHAAIPGCTPAAPDAGTPDDDASAPDPSSPLADSGPEGDANPVSPDDGGSGGCNVSTRTHGRSGALTAIAAFASLVLLRRRRSLPRREASSSNSEATSEA